MARGRYRASRGALRPPTPSLPPLARQQRLRTGRPGTNPAIRHPGCFGEVRACGVPQRATAWPQHVPCSAR